MAATDCGLSNLTVNRKKCPKLKTADPGGFLFLGWAINQPEPPRKSERPPGRNLGNPAPLHRSSKKTIKNQCPENQWPLA
jgi:hypothetical protein